MQLRKKDKKGQIISGLVGGIAGLIILVIVSLLIVDTLNGAGLVTSAASVNTTESIIANYTVGINNVSEKIPTVLLIAAVVLLFGAIVFLVQRSRAVTATQGGAV